MSEALHKAPNIGPEHTVVLYDGVCALCNGTVKFLMKRDAADRFRFAPLQTEFGRNVVRRGGGDPDDLDTVYVVDSLGTDAEVIRKRSRAILHAITTLGGAWKIFLIFRIVPAFLLDLGYRLVAATRYRIFGKKDACPIPPPEHRHKFVMPE